MGGLEFSRGRSGFFPREDWSFPAGVLASYHGAFSTEPWMILRGNTLFFLLFLAALPISLYLCIQFTINTLPLRRFLTLAALAFGVLTASAQREPKLTIKAGAGLTSIVGADADTKLTIAAKAGVSYDVKLYKGLYVIPELDFILKGCDPDGVPASVFSIHKYTKALRMTYLQAPILLAYKFRMKKGGNIVVKAGPYFACGLFGSKATLSGWGFYKRVDVFDSVYGARRFDVGISTALAVERDHFTIGLEYSRGLHRLDPDFRLYNQTFGITLGYRL